MLAVGHQGNNHINSFKVKLKRIRKTRYFSVYYWEINPKHPDKKCRGAGFWKLRGQKFMPDEKNDILTMRV